MGVVAAIVVGVPAGLATASMMGAVVPDTLGPLAPIASALPGAKNDDPRAGSFSAAEAELTQADGPRSRRDGQPSPPDGAGNSPTTAVPSPATTTSAPPTSAEPTNTVPPTTTSPGASAEPQRVPRPWRPPAPKPSPTTPAPAPKPAPTTPAPTGPAAVRADILARTNAERAQVGCGAVHLDDRINAAAQAHSEDMLANNYFSHTGLDGSSFADRLRRAGYPDPRSENIAMGYTNAASVMTGWMNSPGHKANILDCSAKAMGLGLAGTYWTQNFGFN